MADCVIRLRSGSLGGSEIWKAPYSAAVMALYALNAAAWLSAPESTAARIVA